jgi:hypothetical protein
VILSQTIQATRQPKAVLEHLLRIGRHAIVSFPNRVARGVERRGAFDPGADEAAQAHEVPDRAVVNVCSSGSNGSSPTGAFPSAVITFRVACLLLRTEATLKRAGIGPREAGSST